MLPSPWPWALAPPPPMQINKIADAKFPHLHQHLLTTDTALFRQLSCFHAFGFSVGRPTQLLAITINDFGAKLVRRREEHTQATPDRPIDEEELYYDAAGICPKGRVYGLGSLARKNKRYADPGASTSQEPMSQSRIHMDFSANNSQAPPPPPPQEHHQQVGMDPACSPQQQYDDDDRDYPDWVDEEHLGDERCYNTPKELFEGGARRWRMPTAGFVA
ncbi:hypothetical protein Syun_004796 [Stephania yunnanensis]|uniref:Uncharacterized protein n=1 Tax=Stephania yunnanensis TaxID=152371 RepID=A0AAP0L715_9MAGN